MNLFLCQFYPSRLFVFHFNLIFLIPFALSAQVDSLNTETNNSSNAIIDSSIIGQYTLSLPIGLDQLIQTYKKVNYSAAGVDGYRVQIFSESGNNYRIRTFPHKFSSAYTSRTSEPLSEKQLLLWLNF